MWELILLPVILNVALTRTKEGLIIIGDITAIEREPTIQEKESAATANQDADTANIASPATFCATPSASQKTPAATSQALRSIQRH